MLEKHTGKKKAIFPDGVTIHQVILFWGIVFYINLPRQKTANSTVHIY